MTPDEMADAVNSLATIALTREGRRTCSACSTTRNRQVIDQGNLDELTLSV